MRQPRPLDHAFYPIRDLEPERMSELLAERDYEAEGREFRRAILRATLCLGVLLGGITLAGHWLAPAQQAATAPTAPG